MIEFIAAVYNESEEIDDLLNHISPLVDRINIVDDGSTDDTWDKIVAHTEKDSRVFGMRIEHTGLPETVKNEALSLCRNNSWVVMLDADERFTDDTLYEIERFLHDEEENKKWDYVYFNQLEVIDQQHVRTFQKCKLFRKEAITFPLDNIHADDQFEGRGTYFGWEVIHRKSTNKQIKRETEYLATYKKLLAEGKIDEGRYQWLTGLHHYVKPKG